jgi:hypothetical protein
MKAYSLFVRTCFLVLAWLLMAMSFSSYSSNPCTLTLSEKCWVRPIYGTKEMQAMVERYLKDNRNYKQTAKITYYPSKILIEDLNKDDQPEYLVPIDCGLGCCRYVIFEDHPPRVIGEITGNLIIFQPIEGQWPNITTLLISHPFVGACRTEAISYSFKDGKYRELSRRTIEEQSAQTTQQAQPSDRIIKTMANANCSCGKES